MAFAAANHKPAAIVQRVLQVWEKDRHAIQHEGDFG
jgi:hypothetical protein